MTVCIFIRLPFVSPTSVSIAKTTGIAKANDVWYEKKNMLRYSFFSILPSKIIQMLRKSNIVWFNNFSVSLSIATKCIVCRMYIVNICFFSHNCFVSDYYFSSVHEFCNLCHGFSRNILNQCSQFNININVQDSVDYGPDYICNRYL